MSEFLATCYTFMSEFSAVSHIFMSEFASSLPLFLASTSRHQDDKEQSPLMRPFVRFAPPNQDGVPEQSLWAPRPCDALPTSTSYSVAAVLAATLRLGRP